MMPDTDLIVIGAGPAGMEAARVAAEGGLRVLLLDEQARPGGQIYRDVAVPRERSWLGPDYAAGAALVEGLAHPGIRVETRATVWRIEEGPRVLWSCDGASEAASAAHLLIATGAQERPVPFPGWTLPGVMPAGAAQIVMKQAGRVPVDAVVAGAGPLLYLVAAQMIAAGSPPLALVETATRRDLVGAMRHLPTALAGASTLAKGAGLLRRIRAAGVVRYRAASGFRAETAPDGGIVFGFSTGGVRRQLRCRLLLTHLGIIPATHATRAAGISHAFDPAQQAWRPDSDDWGRTRLPGVFVAGDAAGIAGAEAARARGHLAALAILRAAGRLGEEECANRAAPKRRALRRALSVRPFLDAAYPVPTEFLAPANETVVCRCEEVTASAIRAAVASGARGPRAVKSALRAGMGPCQGRMCEPTVSGLVAEGTGRRPCELGQSRVRSPIKPVTLHELASLVEMEDCQ